MQITAIKRKILQNSFIKGTFFYFIISLLNSTIPFAILPLVSRSLSLSEFGNYSLYKIFVAFSMPLVGLAISSAVMLRFYSLKEDEFRTYLFMAISPVLVSLIFFIFIVGIFKSEVTGVLHINSINLLIFALISGAVVSLYNITLTVYRARNQFLQYFIINISFILFYLLVVFIAYFTNLLTLNVVIYGYIFSYFMGWLIGLFLLIKNKLIKAEIRIKYVKDMLRYSLPIALYSIVALIYGLNDKLIINTYLNKIDLAIYAGTAQVAFILSKVGQSIQLAWTPYVFEQYTKYGILSKNVKKYTLYIVGFLIMFALFFVFLYPIIYRIFLPEKYSSGLKFYYFFIIASLFQSIYWLYNPTILFLEKNKYLLYISIISAVVSLALNFYFVRKGIFFVAMVFAISWFIQLFSLLIFTHYVKVAEINKETNS